MKIDSYLFALFLVFTLQSFSEAALWIQQWIKEKGHNPTEFT